MVNLPHSIREHDANAVDRVVLVRTTVQHSACREQSVHVFVFLEIVSQGVWVAGWGRKSSKNRKMGDLGKTVKSRALTIREQSESQSVRVMKLFFHTNSCASQCPPTLAEQRASKKYIGDELRISKRNRCIPFPVNKCGTIGRATCKHARACCTCNCANFRQKMRTMFLFSNKRQA